MQQSKIKNKNPKVTVVIPMKNEQQTIISTIESILLNQKIELYLIVVDDNSFDESYSFVEDFFYKTKARGKLVKNIKYKGQGAGACRNIGIEVAPKDTDYIMFFDADDLMPKNALDKLTKNSLFTKADITVGKYKIAENNKLSDMYAFDKEFMNLALNGQKNSVISPKESPYILGISPAPWTKLIKFDYLQKINLRFEHSPVGNDTYAHWILFMYAKEISVLDECVCFYSKNKNKKSLSQKNCKSKVYNITSFIKLNKIIRNNKKLTCFSNIFNFKKFTTFLWVYSNLNEKKRGFLQFWKRTYRDLKHDDLLILSLYNNYLALEISKVKLGYSLPVRVNYKHSI